MSKAMDSTQSCNQGAHLAQGSLAIKAVLQSRQSCNQVLQSRQSCTLGTPPNNGEIALGPSTNGSNPSIWARGKRRPRAIGIGTESQQMYIHHFFSPWFKRALFSYTFSSVFEIGRFLNLRSDLTISDFTKMKWEMSDLKKKWNLHKNTMETLVRPLWRAAGSRAKAPPLAARPYWQVVNRQLLTLLGWTWN